MPISVEERLKLLRRADAIWGGLWAAFDGLPDAIIDAPNTVGSWSAREVMVHIANWEEETCRRLLAIDAGRPAPKTYTSESELDAWNEEHVAPLRAVSLPEARTYILRCHIELLGVILSSPSVRPEWVLGNYPGHLDELLALNLG